MAKKKSAKQKKQGKNLSAKNRFSSELKKIISGILILIVLVVGAGILAHHVLNSGTLPKSTSRSLSDGGDGLQHPQKPTLKNNKSYKIPKYEIYPGEEIPVQRRTVKKRSASPGALPLVAIIIDDIGYDKDVADKLLALDTSFTFSVLPFSPFKNHIVEAARKKNVEIMLHLPMEPVEYPAIRPGPGGLLSTMSPDELIKQLNSDIDDVPYVRGVNNHMGSKLTTISSQMNQVFSVLKKKRLFFIDSRTTAETLCYQSARLLQVPFAERSVFLDHIQEPAFIRSQLKKLIVEAQKHGEAIGLAHPHIVTYEVIKEEVFELKKSVQLVPASKVVHVVNNS